MKVVTTRRARRDIEEQSAYLEEHFGISVADDYVDAVEERILLLGAEAPSVIHRRGDLDTFEVPFRKHHVILYQFVGNEIHVLRVWPARRDPSTKLP